MFFKNKVLGCGGDLGSIVYCKLYNVANNSWTLFPTGAMQYRTLGSVVINNKFYFFHDTNPSIFDPATNSWTIWPVAPMFSTYSSTVVYKNAIYRFGGHNARKKVFYFNPSINSWIQLNSTAPMEMYESGSGVLPNGNILIVGSGYAGSLTSFAIYNASADSWLFTGSESFLRSQAVLFTIGKRAFMIIVKSVYEFDYLLNTFTLLTFPTKKNTNIHSGSLIVPSGMLNSFPNGCKGIKHV
jgi:hypothetical protein